MFTLELSHLPDDSMYVLTIRRATFDKPLVEYQRFPYSSGERHTAALQAEAAMEAVRIAYRIADMRIEETTRLPLLHLLEAKREDDDYRNHRCTNGMLMGGNESQDKADAEQKAEPGATATALTYREGDRWCADLTFDDPGKNYWKKWCAGFRTLKEMGAHIDAVGGVTMERKTELDIL